MKICLIVGVSLALLVNSSSANTEKQVVKSNNDFSNKLYQAVSSEIPKGNLFMSPLSLHTLLALLYQGSAGATEKELSSVVQLPDKASTAAGYKSLTTTLLNTKGVTLNTANKVYLQSGFKVKKDFMQTARNNFAADAEELNFAQNDAAAATINKWVEDKTNDKIHDLIDPNNINADTRMVLVNAIYFKGNWTHAFKKELTKKEKFYVSETETQDCEMMFMNKDFNYANNKELDAQILELPYSDGKVSMLVVLPKSKTGIKELESKLANMDVAALTANMWNAEVNVKLPKFKIETTIQLTGILKKMGLGNMFSGEANFSGLSEVPLKVSSAVQKAYIDVNEEGTEAAAATEIEFVLDSLPQIRDFKADRPFVFFIISTMEKDKSPIVLFKGKVTKIV